MRVTSRVCAVVVTLAFAPAVRAQEAPKPGPEHEVLKKMVGDWTLTMKFAGKNQSLAPTDSATFFIKDQQSLLIDVTDELPAKSIPVLDKIEGVKEAFKVPNPERILLLVTPKIVIDEEEELILGGPQTP